MVTLRSAPGSTRWCLMASRCKRTQLLNLSASHARLTASSKAGSRNNRERVWIHYASVYEAAERFRSSALSSPLKDDLRIRDRLSWASKLLLAIAKVSIRGRSKDGVLKAARSAHNQSSHAANIVRATRARRAPNRLASRRIAPGSIWCAASSWA